MEHLSTVETLYNEHHWVPTFCPLWQGLPNSGASSIFPVGMVCAIGLLINVAMFTLVYAGRGS